MSDGFNLADAFSGGAPPSNTQNANQPQNPNWSNNPWGAYPGAPGAGQPYPGQQYPGAPGGGQQYPGFPGPGQQYPGAPGGGQPYPGYPAPGQPTPGAPGDGQTFPLFPGAGQHFPGFGPTPTAPTAPQQPSVPSGPGPQPAGQSGPLSIPFNLPLLKGIMPRLLITAQGAVKANPRRFTFDFKRNKDIAFHFNVRFDENPKVIVRNTMINDKWGSEERPCPKFPFEPQKPFQIQFFVEIDCFKVAVNGEPLLQFNHRLKQLHEITALDAYGDLTLNSVIPSMI